MKVAIPETGIVQNILQGYQQVVFVPTVWAQQGLQRISKSDGIA